MKKAFHLEFDDESAAGSGMKHDGITYEYAAEEDERLRVETVNGVSFIYANSSGLLTLSKILIKIAMSKYEDGFHLHLHQDFNADSPEVLGVGLSNLT
jgi:hypothetical protein